MAGLHIVSLYLLIISIIGAHSSKHAVHLSEDNWRDMLKGEWMVEFYAPWCPACKELVRAWSAFADWSKDLGVKVADVDVTASPGLSGRFLVTALPTIYHVKDGVFRLYSGPRDRDDFISFIEEKKWTVIEPLASWKYPDSAQMSVVAQFFKLSMAVRDAHNYLIEKKGLPSWASYMLFGAATLLLGCVLGCIIVYIIDCVFPAASTKRVAPTSAGESAKKDQKKQQKRQGSKDKKTGNKKDASKDSGKDSDGADEEEKKERHSQSEGDASGDEHLRQRKKPETPAAADGKPAESPKKKK